MGITVLKHRFLFILACSIGVVFSGISTANAAAGEPQISAGRLHSLTLDVYGAVSGWGGNLDGQSSPPVPATGYVRITSGSDHNLAIKTDGTVVEWGFNVTAPPPLGLGLPLPTGKPSPLVGVIDVAGGASFSAALLDTYTVVAWGDNSAGQTNVPPTLTGVAAIAAGDAHILALKSNGTVVGWGDDAFSKATGGAALTGIVAVAAGSNHSLALKSDGTVVGWGDNFDGQITIPGGLTGVTAIAANSLYSMALKSDGTVAVWGATPGGGASITAIPAVLTNAATANIVAIAAGALHAMALINDGTIVAWGDDSFGQVSGAIGVNIGVAAGPVDATPPVITLNGAADVYTELGLVYVDAYAMVTDNVDAMIPNLVGASTVNTSAVGTYTVTYTHSDAAKNAATSVVRNVHVQDTFGPFIVGIPLANITAELTGALTPVALTPPAALDTSGVAIVTNNAQAAGFPFGTTIVTWAATDASGNASVTTQNVIVQDTIAPVINSGTPLVDIYVEATGLTTSVTPTPPAATDASGTIAPTTPALGSLPLGSQTITWTATDTAGNTSTAIQNVTVQDTTAPVITLNASSLQTIIFAGTPIELVPLNSTYVDPYAIATDAVDGTVLNLVGMNMVNTSTAGPSTVTYTYKDSSGNIAQATRHLEVADFVKPVLTVNGANPVTVQAGSTYVDLYATAIDNIDATINNVVGNGVVNTSQLGPYTITYNHSDAAKNAATEVTRTVNVVDTTPPTLALNGALLHIVALNGTFVDPGATATDNLDATVPNILGTGTGAVDTSVLGATYTITYTHRDAANNAATPIVRTVKILDRTKPVITLNKTFAGPVTISAGSSSSHALALTPDGRVVAWGSNTGFSFFNTPTTNQAIVPSGLSGVIAIAAGGAASYALKADHTIVSWGASNIPTGTPDIQAVSAGGFLGSYAAVLKTNGTVETWLKNVPTTLNMTGIQAISVGTEFTLGLTANGKVLAEGNNTDLFAGVTTGQVDVPVNLSNVKAVAAGGNHSLALKTDGTVVAWGSNYFYQNGATGIYTGQSIVPAGLNQVKAIAAGYRHSLALKTDGTVVAWGDDADGEATVPNSLSNPATAHVIAIAAGLRFSLALKEDGTIVGWGINTHGQLNAPASDFLAVQTAITLEAGSTFIDPYATMTDNVDATITNLAGSNTVNTAVVGSYPVTYNYTDAGFNDADPVVLTVNVVDTTAPSFTSPANIVVEATGAQTVVSLSNPTTAIDATALTYTNDATTTFSVGTTAVIWTATDASGNVTKATQNVIVQDTTAPVMVSSALADVYVEATGALTQPTLSSTGLAATDLFAVHFTHDAPADGLALGSHVVLWSAVDSRGNISAAMASQTVIVQDSIKPVLRLIGSTTQTLSLGESFRDPGAEVIDAATAPTIINGKGQVDINTKGTYILTYNYTDASGNKANPVTRTIIVNTDREKPVITLKGTYVGPISIAAGYFHSLALKTDDSVVAWGDSVNDQSKVPTGLSKVKAIAAGSFHSLALKTDGTVVAWGWDKYGQGTVPVGLTNVTAIAAGPTHNLALKKDGTVVVWGYKPSARNKVPAGLNNVKAIAAGDVHNLALKQDGTVVGWGDNYYKQATSPAGLTNVTAIAVGGSHSLALKKVGEVSTVVQWGDTTQGQGTVPAGLTGVTAIAAGRNHNLALKKDGTVVAWGDNGRGQSTVPAGLTNVRAIAAGREYSLALKTDGTIVGWGDDYYKQATAPEAKFATNANPVKIIVNTTYNDGGATVTDNVDATINNLQGVVRTVPADAKKDPEVLVGGVTTGTIGTYTVTFNYTDKAGNKADTVVRTVKVIPDPNKKPGCFGVIPLLSLNTLPMFTLILLGMLGFSRKRKS